MCSRLLSSNCIVIFVLKCIIFPIIALIGSISDPALIKHKLIFTIVLKVLAQMQQPAYFFMIWGVFLISNALEFFLF